MPWTWDVVAHRSLLSASCVAWILLAVRRHLRRGAATSNVEAAGGTQTPANEDAPWGLADIGLAVFVWIATLSMGQVWLARSLGVAPETKLVDLPAHLLGPWLWGGGLLLVCATFSGVAVASWRCGARWSDWWGAPREASETASEATSGDLRRGGLASVGRDVACDVRDGLAAFLLLAAPVLVLQELLTRWFPSRHPLVESLLARPSADLLVAVGFSAVLVAPVVEELQFRVLLQGWLSRVARRIGVERGVPPESWLTTHGPTAASATLFSLAHFSHGPDPFPLFVFALGLGELYRRTRRLLPIVVAHGALNAWSMMLLAASIGRGDAG